MPTVVSIVAHSLNVVKEMCLYNPGKPESTVVKLMIMYLYLLLQNWLL